MHTVASLLHTIAHRFVGNIEPDVIHTPHGGTFLVSVNQHGRESPAKAVGRELPNASVRAIPALTEL